MRKSSDGVRRARSGREIFVAGWERTPEEREVCLALEEVAKQVGTKNITAVAIAYVMQKTPYVFPIIGGRKVEHLMSNIEALSIALTPEQVAYLESVRPFDIGFPMNIVVRILTHFSLLRVSADGTGLSVAGRWD